MRTLVEQHKLELDAAIRRLKTHGPDRIMLASDYAVSPNNAVASGYSPIWDIVFVRNDGWTLAAPKHLERVAHQTWPDCWIAVLSREELKI